MDPSNDLLNNDMIGGSIGMIKGGKIKQKVLEMPGQKKNNGEDDLMNLFDNKSNSNN